MWWYDGLATKAAPVAGETNNAIIYWIYLKVVAACSSHLLLSSKSYSRTYKNGPLIIVLSSFTANQVLNLQQVMDCQLVGCQ